ncbi:nitroreductase [Aliikangiella marina]|uniref:Nitroreductase n=1 Tax=Aliikangiella marina TaxID=1712262 RepID=A0A545T7G7_9GAMM|nr:nitroreductase [Aliikangiella marina]TQV73138.1 nitroreductase [Aliikangiella marina]
MSVSQLLDSHYSVRAFRKESVDDKLIQSIFTSAQQSPSNCNTQPWQTYVASGKTKDKLAQALVELIMSGAQPNPEFNWHVAYQGVHRERQFGSANALYSSMGIAREDKQARQMAMLRNWQFFDAPHVVFFAMEKYLDIMGSVDVGIYAQTVALLMADNNIDYCFQGALGMYPDPVKNILGIPDEVGILFGMSFGYADDSAAANNTRTVRENLESSVYFFN